MRKKKIKLVRLVPHSIQYDYNTKKWSRLCPSCKCQLFYTFKCNAVALHYEGALCRECGNVKRMNKCRKHKNEIWKEIPEAPDLYAVSNEGRIMSLRNGCEMKQLLMSNRRQYKAVRLWTGKKYLTRYVSRLVAEAFNLPRKRNEVEVDHIDGNTLNNRLENLRWVTHHVNRTYAAYLYRIGKGRRQGKPFKETSFAA